MLTSSSFKYTPQLCNPTAVYQQMFRYSSALQNEAATHKTYKRNVTNRTGSLTWRPFLKFSTLIIRFTLRHYVQEGTAVCPLGMAAWRALSAAPASAVSTQQPPLHHRHTAALLHDPASHLHYSHTLFYTCGWVGHWSNAFYITSLFILEDYDIQNCFQQEPTMLLLSSVSIFWKIILKFRKVITIV